jgi:hypothetical protein
VRALASPEPQEAFQSINKLCCSDATASGASFYGAGLEFLAMAVKNP